MPPSIRLATIVLLFGAGGAFAETEKCDHLREVGSRPEVVQLRAGESVGNALVRHWVECTSALEGLAITTMGGQRIGEATSVLKGEDGLLYLGLMTDLGERAVALSSVEGEVRDWISTGAVAADAMDFASIVDGELKLPLGDIEVESFGSVQASMNFFDPYRDYIELHVESEPLGAVVSVSGLVQEDPTSTRLAIRKSSLHGLLLELVGFHPCTFGDGEYDRRDEHSASFRCTLSPD